MLGSQPAQIGISPISASMMPPAKMLPKRRRASVIGLTSSSRMFSGSRTGNGSRKWLK